MNDEEASDIIEAVDEAEMRGLHNSASKLKIILEALLHRK